MNDWISVKSGTESACSHNDEELICWGSDNTTIKGQFEKIAVGMVTVCTLLDGSIACTGSTSERYLPLLEPPEGVFAEIDLGMDHGAAIDTNGDIVCWGDNALTNSPLGEFSLLDAAPYHTCALSTDGEINCWGCPHCFLGCNYGQCEAPTGFGYKKVTAGRSHSCAINAQDQIECWGSNNIGESDPPDGTFIDVSAGDGHTCAIDQDSKILCWGSLNKAPKGQFIQVSAGDDDFACAIDIEGYVVCWGDNYGDRASPP